MNGSDVARWRAEVPMIAERKDARFVSRLDLATIARAEAEGHFPVSFALTDSGRPRRGYWTAEIVAWLVERLASRPNAPDRDELERQVWEALAHYFRQTRKAAKLPPVVEAEPEPAPPPPAKRPRGRPRLHPVTC